MSTQHNQSKYEAYRNIFKYHGVFKGARRVFDQFTQNDWYDIVNKTNFSQILSGDDFYNAVDTKNSSVMHYQPVYTRSIKKPMDFLIKSYPILGASSTCFVDLGCGRGKALHVAKSCLQSVTTIGIELNQTLLHDAKINLGAFHQKSEFLHCNVNDVGYNDLLRDYDVVVVFNKNSFDMLTTENTLSKIVDAVQGRALFYIYSNPVFEDSFDKFECVYSMSGWHKNWNTKVFKIS